MGDDFSWYERSETVLVSGYGPQSRRKRTSKDRLPYHCHRGSSHRTRLATHHPSLPSSLPRLDIPPPASYAVFWLPRALPVILWQLAPFTSFRCPVSPAAVLVWSLLCSNLSLNFLG